MNTIRAVAGNTDYVSKEFWVDTGGLQASATTTYAYDAAASAVPRVITFFFVLDGGCKEAVREMRGCGSVNAFKFYASIV